MFKDFLNSKGIKSQANYVEYGYGQVEPNHLSAQRTGQIYAQLPTKADIDVLEQGQFVKYDYVANGNGIGEVNFTGAGEWMLVYNEIKLYHDHFDGSKQWDCEFAMKKGDYQARLYSPYDWERVEQEYNTRYWNGLDSEGNNSKTLYTNVELNRDGKTVTINGVDYAVSDKHFEAAEATNTTPAVAEHDGKVFTYNSVEYELVQKGDVNNWMVTVPVVYAYDKVLSDVENIYDINWTNDPYKKLGIYNAKKMNPGTAMVPRVFKTNIGDIMTTNMINVTAAAANGVPTAAELAALAVGNKLVPNTKGILTVKATPVAGDMVWQVARIYTMPDGQRGVKLIRIA